MSVFTHGVTTKGKPRLINHNQVFTVAIRRKMLSGTSLGPTSDRAPLEAGDPGVTSFGIIRLSLPGRPAGERDVVVNNDASLLA